MANHVHVLELIVLDVVNCNIAFTTHYILTKLFLEEATFEPLIYSFHSSAITGLDVCIRKPLVATCSLDHSVRVWNYEAKYDHLCMPICGGKQFLNF